MAPMIRLRFFLFVLITTIVAGCSPVRFFYYPTRTLYADPVSYGCPYEVVDFKSWNGKKITGLYFKTAQNPKGTVVHLHGNYGNVSNHFTGSCFLIRYGYDVYIFDYEGFGGSEGSPNPKNTVQDGKAMIRYAIEHKRDNQKGVFLFGQSLGGAIAAVVAAEEKSVLAVVLEASFSSYRSMSRHVLKSHVWLWPLYPIAPFFISTKLDPIKYVPRISPRPVLFIHGNADGVVPVAMTEELYKKAQEPKTLSIVEGADHLKCRKVMGKNYETLIANFFDDAAKASSN